MFSVLQNMCNEKCIPVKFLLQYKSHVEALPSTKIDNKTFISKTQK